MNKQQALEHLRKVGLVPPSPMSPQHVAARTFLGERRNPVSWVPVYLRQLGLLTRAEPLQWPAKVIPLRRLLA